MADENINPAENTVIEQIAETAAEVVENANVRVEVAEETNKALIDAAIEDRREQRLLEIDERILSCESRIADHQTATEQTLAEIRNRMETSQAEILERLSSISQNSNQNQIPEEMPDQLPENVVEVAPVKTEVLAEVPAETPAEAVIIEPKPETKGVPGKRKIRLL